MAEVVSLADRLKQRRAELGLSQAQAARELDVEHTAYRLWETETARPAPDRWRLIARWLGESVTTMLLAERLISEAEARAGAATEADFGRSGRDWDLAGAANEGDFFQQGRTLLKDSVRGGVITSEQADQVSLVLDRLEQSQQAARTPAWTPGALRKAFPASERTPRAARDAVAVVAGDVPSETLEIARLLTSELVTNSVKYGPSAPATIELAIEVARDAIRIEVSDTAASRPARRQPSETGGYGLALVDALASRWRTARERDRNVTWFELALPQPGT
jgi:anti-sigma regulatory factor (Ser/Thr protein kinase)/transcriptional regulator with XRE-family HTH domain